MEEILKRFNQVCASHGIAGQACEDLRAVVKAAHRDGWVSATVMDDDDDEPETNALALATERRDAVEPDEDDDADDRMLRKMRKAVRKEFKRGIKRVRKGIAKDMGVYMTAHKQETV